MSEITTARPGPVVGAAAATLAWEIATEATNNLGSGDHGDLMVFVSDQIKVQPPAA
ncbi:MAG: hypothetical protein K8F92_19640 [Hyphomicrobium sp.]|uniref:hypothetical protein n=1 Tax=Hyphomicrobium sp. TaxID=82 RepID=UPI0025C1FD3C|nr:hypothetical protein [Hyphomicrobium sp.]MBZ0211846.1 hypothetical protein [Hyphomicrobium sp.]